MTPSPPVVLYTIDICVCIHMQVNFKYYGFHWGLPIYENSLRKHTLFMAHPAGMAHEIYNRQHTCRRSIGGLKGTSLHKFFNCMKKIDVCEKKIYSGYVYINILQVYIIILLVYIYNYMYIACIHNRNILHVYIIKYTTYMIILHAYIIILHVCIIILLVYIIMYTCIHNYLPYIHN